MNGMNPYLLIIIIVLIARYLVDLVADGLNAGHISSALPSEFEGFYDAAKYETSQKYLKSNTWFGIIVDTVHTLVALIVILTGGFNLLDRMVRSFQFGPILAGVIFIAAVMLLLGILDLPFSAYKTFVIEEKYGFNRTDLKTFVLDIIKSLLVTVVLGFPICVAVLWLFEKTGSLAWLYCWGVVVVFQIVMVFVAPYIIMPLFNKFIPLEEGELRKKVEDYAHDQDFALKGVFKMDGSKRSSKSNAFFTGFGRSRRIVLFDTLIEKHTVPELVAIVAHEMGHYKMRHILKAIVRGIIFSGITFFLLGLFIKHPGLFEAFRMEHLSVYASLLFFGFLYTPISMVISIMESAISRKHEYEADAFVRKTTGDIDAMITGLKKLSVDNLSNVTPHPLKVFLTYSHPPVLERIRALRRFE